MPSVKTTRNDIEYTGSYHVDGMTVEVSYNMRSKSAVAGGAPQGIAIILLGELVDSSLREEAFQANRDENKP